jgi:hypothetical protein
MIRIAITEAAFKAITATLPLGSVAYEAEVQAHASKNLGAYNLVIVTV